jgi:hypothetical protein
MRKPRSNDRTDPKFEMSRLHINASYMSDHRTGPQDVNGARYADTL